MSTGWKSWLMSQPVRRRLVVVLVACCVALVLISSASPTYLLAVPLLAAILAGDLLLYVATRRVAELPEAAVDERQEAVRNRAYRIAYRIIVNLIIWPGGLVALLASEGDPHGWLRSIGGNTTLVIALITAGCQLLAFLPTIVLAWTEPDDDLETI
jgi:uncharacterized membrane protein